VELKPLEDVAHFSGEALDIASQVLADVVLITDELFQVEEG
jgi:hypothetical protein